MRLFAAIPIPRMVRFELGLIQGGVPGARWTQEQNLHMTLAFFGEVDATATEDLHRALASIEAPAFEMSLAGVGRFGDRRPRMLYAQVTPTPPLMDLQARVEAAARRAGVVLEARRFVPHVTIARFSAGAKSQGARIRLEDYLAMRAGFRAGPVAVDAFTLYESRLGGEASVYTALAVYPLTEPTAQPVGDRL